MTFMTSKDGAAGLGWDGHLLLLHGSELERGSRLAKWVRRGLERDEQVVYGQDESVAPKRSVLAVLAQHGIDVQAATADGRLLVLPLDAVYGAGTGGLMARLEQAWAKGYRGVRTSGETSVGRTGAPEEVYPGLAATLERLCRTQPLSALCPYERGTTVGARLEQATAAHTGGIRESQLHTTTTDHGLILAGEVDASNELLLLAAVRAATSPASIPTATSTVPGTLEIDLRRVSFLSAGGCRALAVGTQQFRDQGGGVLLVAPQPIVERVLRLYGLDALTHVELIVGRS